MKAELFNIFFGALSFVALAETGVPTTANSSPTDTNQMIIATPIEKESKGTLVLYRPFRFANLAGSPNIQINDTVIGELRNNRFIELQLMPGEYLITPVQDDWWNIPCGTIKITVEHDKKSYVRMDSSSTVKDLLIVNGNAVSADSDDKCWIDSVDGNQAQIELKKIKRASEKQMRRH